MPIQQNFASLKALLIDVIPEVGNFISERYLEPDPADGTISRRQIELFRFDVQDTLQELRNLLNDVENEVSEREISEVCRQDIFDLFELNHINWYGQLEQCTFLSRLYDLTLLPSKDSRYKNAAEELANAPPNNQTWLYNDERFALGKSKDSVFLRFLCETLHPVVRLPEESKSLVSALNSLLANSNWQIVVRSSIAGAPVYSSQKMLLGAIIPTESDSESGFVASMTARIESIRKAVNTDPDTAILLAADFLNSACMHILERRRVEVPENSDLAAVVLLTTTELDLDPEKISSDDELGKLTTPILQALTAIAINVAKLRQSVAFQTKGRTIKPRQARIACGAAACLAIYLEEVYRDWFEKDASD